MPKPANTFRFEPQTILPVKRLALLNNVRFAELERWREELEERGRRLPHFDPLDGGADARLLILLETPGPGDAPVRFVSRDNKTGTARNLRHFLGVAAIPRRETVLWNAVPWIVHSPGDKNRPLREAEIAEGLKTVPGLMDRLPRLEVVLLAGRIAQRSAETITARRPGLAVHTMPHPSPANVCTNPDISTRITLAVNSAATILGLKAACACP
ncbi:uracil-DNA glycosylase [Labrys wisconsinensis]|uniref:Uracil-DNA glycosylase-like domain-containing protein n=1 Tax=Labrys wisconsinensis TaxID=425677 RepID=A0ABU0J7H2_9HYPH|nr:uracil-DNA glycosylase [Labrys wisconsinensis]MDQ0470213.1 hypothetical protein [Labrys wisconsinensis]